MKTNIINTLFIFVLILSPLALCANLHKKIKTDLLFSSTSITQQNLPNCEFFQIVNKKTNKCIRLSNPNDRLLQWECDNYDHFLWKITRNANDGSYVITSKTGNFVWDSNAALGNNGNGIINWSLHNGANQRWFIEQWRPDINFLRFRVKHANKCMDVPGGSFDNGAGMLQWDCQDGNENQGFSLKCPVIILPTLPNCDYVQIVNKKSNKCVKFGNVNDKILQNECDTTDQFLWKLTRNADDNSYFISSKAGNNVWDSSGSHRPNGNPIINYGLHGGANQRWFVQSWNPDNNFLKFTVKHSGRCLDLPGGNTAENVNFEQWDCTNGNENQAFTLRCPIIEFAPQAKDCSNGWTQIVNKVNGKCLKLLQPSNVVVQGACQSDDVFLWKLQVLEDGHYLVYSKLGNFVWDSYGAQLNNGNPLWNWHDIHKGNNQRFRIRGWKPDSSYFKFIFKHSGKCLDVPGGSNEENKGMQQWDCADGNNNQAFQFRCPIEEPVFTPQAIDCSNGWTQIINKGNNKCVKFEHANNKIVQASCESTDEFLWRFEANEDGTYLIYSKKGNLVFDSYASLFPDGNPIWNWNPHKNNNQRWFVKTWRPDSQYFRIIDKHAFKCLDVPGGSTADGATMQHWSCTTGNNNQAFYFRCPPPPFVFTASDENCTSSFTQIVNKVNGKCVKLLQPSNVIVQGECQNDEVFLWKFVSNGDGSFLIYSKLGNFVFDSYASALNDGNHIFNWHEVHKGNNQRWIVKQWAPDNNYYRLIVKHANKCLDVPGGSNDENKFMQQWTCADENNNQAFEFRCPPQEPVFTPKAIDCSNGWTRIVNKGNNKCVKFELANNKIVQGTCGNGDEFLWRFEANEDGTYLIYSKKGNLVFDSYASLFPDGNPIWNWNPHKNNNQRWFVKTWRPDSKFFRIIDKHAYKCLDVPGGSTADGATMQHWSCTTGNNNQAFYFECPGVEWKFIPNQSDCSDSYTSIVSKVSGKCIKFDLPQNRIVQATCDNTDSFLWRVTKNNDDGTFVITSKRGNYVFDSYGSVVQNGNNIINWPLHNGANQRWSIKQWDKDYLRFIVIHANKCLDVPGGSKKDNEGMIQWDCVDGNNNQAFQFKCPVAELKFTPNSDDCSNSWTQVINKVTNKCLKFNVAQSGIIQSSCGAGDSFLWKVTLNSDDGSYIITSKLGNYVFDSYGALTNNGNTIINWPLHNGLNQRFFIKLWVPDGNFFRFINKNANKCVDIPGGNAADGIHVQQWDCADHNGNQAFMFRCPPVSEFVPNKENCSDSWTRVVNKKTNKCVKFDKPQNKLVQANCGVDDTFLWRINKNNDDGTFIFTSKKDNFVWDSYGGQTNNGNSIINWPLHGGKNQRWAIFSWIPDNKYFRFIVNHANKCLTTPDNADSVQQFDCQNNNENQAFFLQCPAAIAIPSFSPKVPSTDKWIQIIPKASNKCLAFDSKSGKLVQLTCSVEDNFLWTILKNPDGSFTIINKSGINSPAIVSEGGLTNSGNPVTVIPFLGGDNGKFVIVEQGDSFNLIFVNSGKCLDLPSGNTTDGVNMQQADCITTGVNQLFQLRPYEQGYKGNIVPSENEWVQIINKGNKKCFRYVQAQNNLVQDDCSEEDAFLWKFTKMTDGNYIISNRQANWQFIIVPNGSGSNGDSVFTWSKGDENGVWIIKNWKPDNLFIIFQNFKTNKCISVPEGKLENKLALIQFDCLDNDNNSSWNFKYVIPKNPPVVSNETIKGLIKSATTGLIIPNDILTLRKLKISFKNTDNGNVQDAFILDGSLYSITLPQGNYERIITMEQYSKASSVITVSGSSDETNENNTMILSPMVSGWRVVLTWGDQVKDLDVHVLLPQSEGEVYWNKKSSPDGTVTFDVDDIDKFGPETITINKVKPGKYIIFVRNYSKDNLLKFSDAKVEFYNNSGLVAESRVPTLDHDALRTFWIAGEIVVDNDLISRYNERNELAQRKPIV